MKTAPKVGSVVICNIPFRTVEGTVMAVCGNEAWIKTKGGTSYVWDWSDMTLLTPALPRSPIMATVLHEGREWGTCIPLPLGPHHHATPRD